jgi:CTP:molybdopterin cytidylyltransferase MocA
MTVAAVALAASPASALADADGVTRIRRIADAAWSGGAMPVIVVSFDPDGLVAASLAGATVTPAQMARGIDVARGLVTETDAALLWPARLGWVGPETVTSLIEAHGTAPDAILRPTYHGEVGWPALVPLACLDLMRSVVADAMPDRVLDELAGGFEVRHVDLGDPGTVIDGDTPRGELPPYEGPPEPPAGHEHEWGAAIADEPEGAPARPRSVPYPG